MELPSRPKPDRFTPPGAHRRLRESLRARLAGKGLTAVLFYCFDRRTRILPFLFADVRIVPAGARQVAAALLEAGLADIRIVLQQWSPNVRPSQTFIGGRRPDMLLFSAMSLHSAPLNELIADAAAIPEAERPLVACGGPRAIYQPEFLFQVGGDPAASPDVACTGEDYILLELLDRLADDIGPSRSLRQAFRSAAGAGALLDVPGLVYAAEHPRTGAPCLVNTGPQRLVQDLDELPSTLPGYQKVEPRHKNTGLAAAPMPLADVARKAPYTSVTLTQGCKFACGYCPIPSYNQRTFRHKSSMRVAEEMYELGRHGFRAFLGTDDNFFNNRAAAEDMVTTVAKFRHDRHGDPGVRWRWATEATIFDTHRNRDLMKAARGSGMQALWFGVEDLTAELVNKGQSAGKTREVFELLRAHGIMPMPMMIHSDGQPLVTRGGLRGLLNQVNFLRSIGAGTVQVNSLTPGLGSKWYEKTFEDGLVFDTVNGRPVEDRCFDGGHVIATADPAPWRRQLNLLAGYALFYNPVNLIGSLFRPDPWHLVGLGAALQIIGMAAVAKTAVESLRWAAGIAWGGVTYSRRAPAARIEMLPASEFRPAPAALAG